MEAEKSAQLRRRAHLHAALADPARLAIVDALVLGDASPSELQALVGMASNLLAHHVKVLESRHIVARTRSEGDRRRTYLRLVPGTLEGLMPTGTGQAPRVVFVCTHNCARSQLAAALWRRASQIPVASAGTHPAERIDPGAVEAAARHGIPLRRQRPRPVADVLDRDDFVVTVCDNAHEELDDIPRAHWSVPDPVRVGTAEAFDGAVTELSRRVSDLVPRLCPH